jgi:hypothetical protein
MTVWLAVRTHTCVSPAAMSMTDERPGTVSISKEAGEDPMCAGSNAAPSPQQTTLPALVTAQKKLSPPLMHATRDGSGWG